MSKGNDLHAKAIKAHEQEQDFLKALKFTDEAIIASGEEGDSGEIAGILGSRQNIFSHLYDKTQNKNYLILAKYEAEAAVEIAEKSDTSAALPYRDLAKAYEQLNDYPNAVTYLEKAINSKLPDSHNRPAVKAEIKAHLAYTKYKAGDKSGMNLMNEAIAELENAKEDKNNKDVWLSGAHMRTAEMLKEDNLDLAKEHLRKAKEIIDVNNELKLRAEQWKELAKDFNG